jgi:hypothetical protein
MGGNVKVEIDKKIAPSISLCADDCKEYFGKSDLEHGQEFDASVKVRVSSVSDDYGEKGEKRYTLEFVGGGKEDNDEKHVDVNRIILGLKRWKDN